MRLVAHLAQVYASLVMVLQSMVRRKVCALDSLVSRIPLTLILPSVKSLNYTNCLTNIRYAAATPLQPCHATEVRHCGT